MVSAVATIMASFVTLAATVWWPAWIILFGLWTVALVFVLRPSKADVPVEEPLDFA